LVRPGTYHASHKTNHAQLGFSLTVVRQLIPQIIINYRRHDTEGLQPSMMLLWAAAGLPLGVYNIIENFNIALRIQPQILTTLSLITWAQCVYYERVRNPSTPLVGNLADGARE
jgi:hypothetical protein